MVFNNGLIIQFGNYNIESSNIWIEITLPTAFSITFYSVCLIQRNDFNPEIYAGTCIPGVKNRTKTTMDIGFRWVNTHIKAYGCWFAIGY